MMKLDRRDFCAVSGASLLGFAQAALAQMPVRHAQQETTLVLFRAGNAASRAFAADMAAQGWPTRALESDLVRHWRHELGQRLNQGWALAGQLDWDDWFLLRGLAAEQRHFPLHEQQVSHNLFHWVLG